MTAVDEKIEKVQARLKQLRAEKQKQDVRVRAANSKKERAADTRRKILLGAFVMEKMQKDGIGTQLVMYSGHSFDGWLVREADRDLFGLSPKA